MRRKKETLIITQDLSRYIYLDKQTCDGQTLFNVLKEADIPDSILNHRVDIKCQEYEVFAFNEQCSFDTKKALFEHFNPKEETVFSYDTNIEVNDEMKLIRFYWRALKEEHLIPIVYPKDESQKEKKQREKEEARELKKLSRKNRKASKTENTISSEE